MRIAKLAECQHGVVSVAQLRSLGLSASATRMRAASGRLHRVQRGVYAVGAGRLDRDGKRMAAVLACGAWAVLSHRTAADALGILPNAGGLIDVTVPGRSGRSRPGLVIHRARRLADDERGAIDGIPCTSPARTLLDLAAVVKGPRLAWAIEGAERTRQFDGRALEAVLARAGGRPAAARLRSALAAYRGEAPPTRREFERLALGLFERAGLPSPRVNKFVDTPAEPLEVDFCWPERRLIVEADSWEWHGTRARFENDRRRDQLLRRAGWAVVRITWRQLRDSPDEVIAALA
jgi:hypothetical protein